MKAIIFLGQNIDIKSIDFKDSYIVGVDMGALMLANNKINMDLSIGDFDTAGISNIDLIKSYSKKYIKLNPIKDDSDTEAVLKELYDKFDEIIIYGGLSGKRVEHLISNLLLLIKYPQIKFIDNYSYVELVDGEKVIYKDNYKYISFFSMEESTISLKGFKYNLENKKVRLDNSFGLSNEIVEDIGIIKTSKPLLCIKSMNDNN